MPSPCLLDVHAIRGAGKRSWKDVVEAGPVEVRLDQLAAGMKLRTRQWRHRPLDAEARRPQPRIVPRRGHPAAEVRADECVTGLREIVERRGLLVEYSDLGVAWSEAQDAHPNRDAGRVDGVSDLNAPPRDDRHKCIPVRLVSADLVKKE